MRRMTMKAQMSLFLTSLLLLLLKGSLSRAGVPPVAIFHAFDRKYEYLDQKRLEKLSQSGFSHIQLSPSQRSVRYGEWHEKYQPIGYEVGNSYGSAADLKALTKRAHEAGLKVIADVVLNHLAAIPGVTGEDWRRRFEDEDQAGFFDLYYYFGHLFATSENPQSLFTRWNPEGWLGGNLPQLNTKDEGVRSVQLGYLKNLIALGIDGFRFDAIGTIPRESLAYYRRELGESVWSYGELISMDVGQNQYFSAELPVTDFILTQHLISVFSASGWLTSLKVPQTNTSMGSVTFAINHDTVAAKKSNGNHGVYLVFGDEKDEELATLFVLARQGGVPLIFDSQAKNPSVLEGVTFRKKMAKVNAPMEYVLDSHLICSTCSDETFLWMRRGRHGLFVLNKASEPVVMKQAQLDSDPESQGCYRKVGGSQARSDSPFSHLWIETTSKGKVGKAFPEGDFVMPPRTGFFFEKVASSFCKT